MLHAPRNDETLPEPTLLERDVAVALLGISLRAEGGEEALRALHVHLCALIEGIRSALAAGIGGASTLTLRTARISYRVVNEGSSAFELTRSDGGPPLDGASLERYAACPAVRIEARPPDRYVVVVETDRDDPLELDPVATLTAALHGTERVELSEEELRALGVLPPLVQ